MEKNPVCVEKNPVKMEKNIAWIPPIDESLMLLLAVNYDADIHDVFASLRILDGTIPRHAKHGAPVIVCFAPARIVKLFVKPNTPVLG